MKEFIRVAALCGVILTPEDFEWEEGMGGWTIDGMVPEEWLEAMTEDNREELLACGE